MSDLTYLAHHGVKGQKHGVRQWQNADGSLTPAGRIHYGVGAARSAVKSVGTAIRKKVKPTNAELNVKIRKEKSKILNKQKKEELKRLKKTGQITDPEKRIGHKKYAEMTDQEISDRIKRLKSEAELAMLEASRNMSPGKRMVTQALEKGISTGIQTAVQSGLKSSGETFIKRTLGFDEAYNKEQKEAAEKAERREINDARINALVRESKKARKKEQRERNRERRNDKKDVKRQARDAKQAKYLADYAESHDVSKQQTSSLVYIPGKGYVRSKK